MRSRVNIHKGMYVALQTQYIQDLRSSNTRENVLNISHVSSFPYLLF